MSAACKHAVIKGLKPAAGESNINPAAHPNFPAIIEPVVTSEGLENEKVAVDSQNC